MCWTLLSLLPGLSSAASVLAEIKQRKMAANIVRQSAGRSFRVEYVSIQLPPELCFGLFDLGESVRAAYGGRVTQMFRACKHRVKKRNAALCHISRAASPA